MTESRESPLGRNTSREIDQQLVDTIVYGLEGLRYGAIEITVHDGRVVQIERREKLRLGASREVGVSRSVKK